MVQHCAPPPLANSFLYWWELGASTPQLYWSKLLTSTHAYRGEFEIEVDVIGIGTMALEREKSTQDDGDWRVPVCILWVAWQKAMESTMHCMESLVLLRAFFFCCRIVAWRVDTTIAFYVCKSRQELRGGFGWSWIVCKKQEYTGLGSTQRAGVG